jgi:hypothetical protein
MPVLACDLGKTLCVSTACRLRSESLHRFTVTIIHMDIQKTGIFVEAELTHIHGQVIIDAVGPLSLSGCKDLAGKKGFGPSLRHGSRPGIHDRA